MRLSSFFFLSLSILFTSGNVAKCDIPPNTPSSCVQSTNQRLPIDRVLPGLPLDAIHQTWTLCVCEVQQRAEPCSCPSLFTPSLHTQVGNVELFGAAAGRFLFFLPLESQTKTPEKSSPQPKKPLTFRYIHPIPGWI
jgi:hypothetical protein